MCVCRTSASSPRARRCPATAADPCESCRGSQQRSRSEMTLRGTLPDRLQPPLPLWKSLPDANQCHLPARKWKTTLPSAANLAHTAGSWPAWSKPNSTHAHDELAVEISSRRHLAATGTGALTAWLNAFTSAACWLLDGF